MEAQFSERYYKYKAYALKICAMSGLPPNKSEEICLDLLHDVYLKLHKAKQKDPSKTFDDSYVYLSIRSALIDSQRKISPIPVLPSELYSIPDEECPVMASRTTIDDALSDMKFFDREILLRTQETSLRKVAKEVGVSYSKVYQWQQEALKNLKEKL